MSGIYQIKNLVNGKVCVGSTISFRKRFLEHKKDLLRNEHDNDHLQKTWNKVNLIRKKWKQNENTQVGLAKEFNVSRGCIRAILKNRTWISENQSGFSQNGE